MNDFEPLSHLLRPHYDKSWQQLPEAIKARVRREFPPAVDRNSDDPRRPLTTHFVSAWDDFSPGQRRLRALQSDWRRHPDLADGNQAVWDLQRRIEDWEAVATPTACDLARQEANLSRLRRELADAEASLARKAEFLDANDYEWWRERPFFGPHPMVNVSAVWSHKSTRTEIARRRDANISPHYARRDRRFTQFASTQREIRQWRNFDDIADEYGRRDGTVRPKVDLRQEMFGQLLAAMIGGRFNIHGKAQVFYLNASVAGRIRMTPKEASVLAPLPDPVTEAVLKQCWVPVEILQRWLGTITPLTFSDDRGKTVAGPVTVRSAAAEDEVKEDPPPATPTPAEYSVIPNNRGRQPVLKPKAAEAMAAKVRSGEITIAQLRRLPQKKLVTLYSSASTTILREARKAALGKLAAEGFTDKLTP